ncbi:MAG: Crp/Fnr family transcriptional regulator [Pseudobdellovibrio sp.]
MSCNRGQSFNTQNSPALDVYCIASGNAKITHFSDNSAPPSIVRIAAGGDLLGYRCIFSETNYRATASALESSKVCKISNSFIFSLIEESPDFSRELLKRMGQEISSAENHHHSFVRKNVRERVAEALILLKNKSSVQVPQGQKIDIKLNRSELASWVGTAKETLIRALADLREEKLIEESEDDCIIILDLEKLYKVAGNDFSLPLK